MSEGTFHLFVYGTLRADESAVLNGAERLREATVEGTLFDLGEFPALVLAGRGRVHGEIWRCPHRMLPILDRYEAVDEGLYRRAGVRIGDLACWVYVAGPRLAPRLTPSARIPSGRWRGPGKRAGRGTNP